MNPAQNSIVQLFIYVRSSIRIIICYYIVGKEDKLVVITQLKYACFFFFIYVLSHTLSIELIVEQ